MKKTNILVEVDDNLYEEIVLPYKKKKSFGKLVVQLLTAYYENESIYSYINGAIDDMHDEAKDELLKDLQNMANSLNNLSMLQKEAEVTIDNGYSEIKDFGESAYNDTMEKGTFNTGTSETKPEDLVTREDVENIVKDSLKGIESMLSELLHSKVVVSENTTPVVQETREVTREVAKEVNKEVNTEVIEEPKTIEEPREQNGFEEVKRTSYIEEQNSIVSNPKEDEPSPEEEDMAQNALSALLGSLGDY